MLLRIYQHCNKVFLRPREHVLLQLSGEVVATQLCRDRARSSLCGSRLSCWWLSAVHYCHPHLRSVTFGTSDPFQLLLKADPQKSSEKDVHPTADKPKGKWWHVVLGVVVSFQDTEMPWSSKCHPLLAVICRTAQPGIAT